MDEFLQKTAGLISGKGAATPGSLREQGFLLCVRQGNAEAKTGIKPDN
jgi:hypothetical protein